MPTVGHVMDEEGNNDYNNNWSFFISGWSKEKFTGTLGWNIWRYFRSTRYILHSDRIVLAYLVNLACVYFAPIFHSLLFGRKKGFDSEVNAVYLFVAFWVLANGRFVWSIKIFLRFYLIWKIRYLSTRNPLWIL